MGGGFGGPFSVLVVVTLAMDSLSKIGYNNTSPKRLCKAYKVAHPSLE